MINTLFYYIFAAFWYMLCYFPLQLLRIVYEILNITTLKLPMFILFGGTNYQFSKTLYYFFTLAALAFFVMFIIVLIKFTKASKSAEKRFEFKVAFKQALIMSFLMFLIPLILFIVHLGIIALYEVINSLLKSDSSSNISSEILRSLTPSFNEKHAAWAIKEYNTQVVPTFLVPSRTIWDQILTGQSALLIIEVFLSAVATLYVFLGLFLRVCKSIFLQFGLFMSLPVHISLSVKDQGLSLKRWISEYSKILFGNLLIMIFLIVFIIFIDVANIASKSLIDAIFSDPSLKVVGSLISALITIGLIVSAAFGFDKLVEITLRQFGLDELAKSPVFKFKKAKNNNSTNNKETSKTETKTKETQTGISSSKNAFAQNKNIAGGLMKTESNIQSQIKGNNNMATDSKAPQKLKMSFSPILLVVKKLSQVLDSMKEEKNVKST